LRSRAITAGGDFHPALRTTRRLVSEAALAEIARASAIGSSPLVRARALF